ncbi:MAG TPA: enhanced serine sensitivity protein SseB C-terminal domain-containing protein [Chitinophagaceae bacterium]|nr:enhanced serine sensitivity protein SseB C-terminal domain-containing protein [Chitinophagaceae bacterium]
MALFDFFKSGGKALALDALLEKAVKDASYRPEFYKRLLSDKLTVITKDLALPQGKQILQEETKINIFSFPDKKIPVFTSPDRIFDKGVVKAQVQYMQMKGYDLFKIVKRATFILNPYSDYGKELLPEEIESILLGKYSNFGYKEVKVNRGAQMQIGQPAKYPTEIADALKAMFVTFPEVRAAYLGWIFAPGSGDPPHYIFAFEGEGDLKDIISKAGLTVQSLFKPGEFADFIKIDNKDGLSNYLLNNTEPFYKR